MKTRWWDSKNEVGPHLRHFNKQPCSRDGKRDDHVVPNVDSIFWTSSLRFPELKTPLTNVTSSRIFCRRKTPENTVASFLSLLFFDSNPIIQKLTPLSMYLWYPFFCDHILNKSHRSHYGGLDQYHAMKIPFCCSQANELLPELICCCLLRKPGVLSRKQVLAPLKPAQTSALCQSCKLLRVTVLRSYKLLRREVWHRYKMVQHKWCKCNCSFLRFGQNFLH